jgi:nucleotidyltransferase/DNA polymerase involved in DNA repair
MNANAASCLWPRAILVLRCEPDDASTRRFRELLQSRYRHDATLLPEGVIVDITHLQPDVGPPFEIALELKQLIPEPLRKTAAIGVAPNLIVARFVARQAAPGTVKLVAPWEVATHVAHTTLSDFYSRCPEFVFQLFRVGVRSGASLTSLPVQTVQKYFGDRAVELWHACHGTGASSLTEVRCRHNAVYCRVVLPPRTGSLKSLASHLRRISGVFAQSLRRTQRQPGQILFIAQVDDGRSEICTSLPIKAEETAAAELVRILVDTVKANWNGAAITRLELRADNLTAPGGQLELFAA